MEFIKHAITFTLIAILGIALVLSLIFIPSILIFNKLEKKFNIDPVYVYPIVFVVVIIELLIALLFL